MSQPNFIVTSLLFHYYQYFDSSAEHLRLTISLYYIGPAMATESSFQFGIEVELLLGCRKKTYQSWKLLAKDVSKRLLKAGIANHINETNDKSRENYREWSIVQEVTIPSQPGKNLCKVPAEMSSTDSCTTQHHAANTTLYLSLPIRGH